MGSIYKRGARAQARYYLHYRVGKKEDGSPRYEMRAAKGTRTMGDARKQLAKGEVLPGGEHQRKWAADPAGGASFIPSSSPSHPRRFGVSADHRLQWHPHSPFR